MGFIQKIPAVTSLCISPEIHPKICLTRLFRIPLGILAEIPVCIFTGNPLQIPLILAVEIVPKMLLLFLQKFVVDIIQEA